jgi:hypothetical protein
MQKFSSWINQVFLENANPAQLIATLQQNLAKAQQDLAAKNGALQNLAALSKSNPAALNNPQLAAALQVAAQKNDFTNLIKQVTELQKQPAPQQPAQQQAPKPGAKPQPNPAGNATPPAVPAPQTGAPQQQRQS